ncbi:aminoacyl-tRNA hydrolase [Egibacter rhizosphaerae]|uniref:Aminoacyl-tRNA hydrolase n=1 Tax=Egibacter rhizosphaerae TaxID=1670831 RepID=A0A411YE77_9ACTN|nr:alternative ribosome rescue aminoacyl-tRNA hydrolase ArfB [Egibacter rhizosphaerae]QBI19432.1 aminoacyl-tRNA hydrolase [Egibacter rhizosphaerae]
MPEDGLPIRDGLVIPEPELSLSFARSGGPGGQHANTSATKVQLRFDVEGSPTLTEDQKARIRSALGHRMTIAGELVLEASEHRSQTRNREAVRGRLQTLLAEALTPQQPRRPTRRPRSAEARRLEHKRRRGERKRLRKPPEG